MRSCLLINPLFEVLAHFRTNYRVLENVADDVRFVDGRLVDDDLLEGPRELYGDLKVIAGEECHLEYVFVEFD